MPDIRRFRLLLRQADSAVSGHRPTQAEIERARKLATQAVGVLCMPDQQKDQEASR